MLAHLVFGLTDAVTLEAKPGTVLWVMFGLGAALAYVPGPAPGTDAEGIGPDMAVLH